MVWLYCPLIAGIAGAILYNYHMDTLSTHMLTSSINFIFGDATAFFQDCTLIVKKKNNGRPELYYRGSRKNQIPSHIENHSSKLCIHPVKDVHKANTVNSWKGIKKIDALQCC